MKLKDIQESLQEMRKRPAPTELRAVTYLATYPSILELGTAKGKFNLDRFHQLAAMVYGWMPRIVRLNSKHKEKALVALSKASESTHETAEAVLIQDVANCLHSAVGASKMLHFVRPEVFPIWDSNVERVRLGDEPPYNHMNQTQNYWNYFREVHSIRKENGFDGFLEDYNSVLAERLRACAIAPYRVLAVRAIEAVTFENPEGDA
jgi:hypothetical protein